jgi:uncharacterized protein with PCYCGC motif
MRFRGPVLLTLFSLSLSFAGAAALAHDHAKPVKPNASGKQALNSCLACKERRAVLDPNLFASLAVYEPEVKPAYEAARKYPATLDRIHCFCECAESERFHHKNLLTCFTDMHAAGCGICIKEALLAADLKARGASDEEVEATVEKIFKTDGHPPTRDAGR